LKEERRLTVFEKRALSIIFGVKRNKLTGEWRKLHNEGLTHLFSSSYIISSDKIEKIEMSGAYSTYGGEERCIQGNSGET